MPFNLFKPKKQPAGPLAVKAESERMIKALEWISDRTLADWADTPDDT